MTYKKIITLFVSACLCFTTVGAMTSCSKNGDSNSNNSFEAVVDDDNDDSIEPISKSDCVLQELVEDGDYIYAVYDKHVEIAAYMGSEANIEIPSKYKGKPITALGIYAFTQSFLETVVIPDTVEEIRENCFTPINMKKSTDDKYEQDTYLIGAVLNDSTPNLELYPSALKKVVLPKKLLYIGSGAFSCCTSLEDIHLPDSVQYIGSDCFFNCVGLKGDIVLPKNLTQLYQCAFLNCTSISEVKINKKLETICGETFKNCSSLEKVDIPDNIEVLGIGAFSNCSSLKEITLSSEIIKIPESCFENCTSLNEIVIPDSIGYIGESAFKGCTSLQEITIPSHVSTIEDSAFDGTPWLETAPDTINDIPIKNT